MKEVLIYGAGDAGMVAALNLAREGYAVTVRDAESGIGGSHVFNPSAHTTPIDVERTSSYIGVDLAPVMHPSPVGLYIHDTRVMFKSGLYTVERGDREGSLDVLLYDECLRHGVRFEFGTPLRREDLGSLPPGTIVACGLNPAVYEMLGLPHQRWYAWISRGSIGFSGYCLCWMDECVTEYGYLSTVNGSYFNMLASLRPVSRGALDKYEDFLVRMEGIEHRDWAYRSGAVPVPGPGYPCLFHDGLILAGTLGGWIDPLLGFGILGSLTSGRVAALAVTDPSRAREEFRRFNRRYTPVFRLKDALYYPLRRYLGLLERANHAVGLERAQYLLDLAMRLRLPGAVPGYARFLGSG